MAVLSGKKGEIDIGTSTLLHFANGNLNYGAKPEGYYARDGGGARKTASGGEEGEGSFDIMADDAVIFDDLVKSGDLVAMVYRHKEGATTPLAKGNGRIGQINRVMNRDGTLQRLTVNFMCDGRWTDNAGTALSS